MKEHGAAEGLSDAAHLADGATYQEVICRSALNPVKGMPFNWTLNPYRGCTHGCHYCFARRYHAQFELNSDDAFSSVILVKRNFVEVLRKELDKPSWKREYVAVGTATDVYQPIEGQYKLTRRSLEALALSRTPAGIITKGPMIVRDKDVLLELSRRAGCTVYVSVPTVDEDAWRTLEPGTAHPLAAPARRSRAERRGRAGRRPDESDRAGPHVTTRPARANHQGHRRSRRGVHGHEPPLPERRHTRALHELPGEALPRPGDEVPDALSRRVRARGCTRRKFAAW